MVRSKILLQVWCFSDGSGKLSLQNSIVGGGGIDRDVEFRLQLQLLIEISLQVRYAATEIHPTKSARARGAYLRVSFKNTRETAQAINGWKLQRAVKFLENVQEHKEAVPMRRYAGGTGRAAQGTESHDILSKGGV
jgi:hypothetical protein